MIGPTAVALLRAYDPPRPVRLLGVRVGGVRELGSGGRGSARGRSQPDSRGLTDGLAEAYACV